MPDTITNDQVVAWVRTFAAQVAEQKSALTKLDAAIGDGDHGTNMDRGMRKVLEKLDGAQGDDIGATLKAVGMTLVSSVGGASGPLYGTLFMQMGAGTAGATELDLDGWTQALAKGTEGVRARGKAEPGDKTMIDALAPAVEALKANAGGSLADALTASADAAQQGMEATIPLVARKGRASYLGERSADHQDPGATSTHLLLRAAADTLAG
ncbi:MAG: dihydroxyacetone kinase subunit DhaL [Actinomycetota bacterium]|nr:dihydroxyacetone kinase subunit DhaL [Actinomycetota bacterium]